ncbi:MAG: thiamine pyrophosphate-dependent enzyme [Candidatus Gastranaerophilaceae bacterium]|jgi:2-oxoglutarate ferredoxin oxidoreductase subunit beta
MDYDKHDIDIAWCPGCGDFLILKILKEALTELNLQPENTMIVSGIGQASKIPHYLNCNFFNGLHGRILPPATAIKVCNPELNVIAEGGDGDLYGEGGNHFIHTIRRNPDITTIAHNNMVYGLTKGQASPSSQKGYKTPIQVSGVEIEPFNPIAIAIAQDASFVARAFCQDMQQTKEIFKKAILHKGFAFIDVFQPCVTFNKVNTYKWFKDNTYYLEETHIPSNRVKAFEKAIETEKFPLGIFYINSDKVVFEETKMNIQKSRLNIFERRKNRKNKVENIIESLK